MSLQAVRPARRAVICGCSPHASSSRPRLPAVRPMSSVANRPQEAVPFFTPPSTSPVWSAFKPTSAAHDVKGKGKVPQTPGGEEEVDDGEWEMRIARAMLHLRESLPQLFDSRLASAELFPPDVFSKNVVLKLPAPLPLKLHSLARYSMAFSIARNGMQALHTDLRTTLERMTFSPCPPSSWNASPVLLSKPIPSHRQKQIRVLLQVHAIPRLPPHHEHTWHTSSLYTFSPYSGLIMSHEVETIRPLPGEGVGEFLMTRLLGWTSRTGQGEGAIPAPGHAAASEVVPVRCTGRSRDQI